MDIKGEPTTIAHVYFFLCLFVLFETFLEDVMKSLMSFCHTVLLSKG